MDGYAISNRHEGGSRSGLCNFMRTEYGGLARDFENNAMTIYSGKRAGNTAESALRIGDGISYIDADLFTVRNDAGLVPRITVSAGTVADTTTLTQISADGNTTVTQTMTNDTVDGNTGARYKGGYEIELDTCDYTAQINGSILIDSQTHYPNISGASYVEDDWTTYISDNYIGCTVNIGTGGDREINIGSANSTLSLNGNPLTMQTYGGGDIDIQLNWIVNRMGTTLDAGNSINIATNNDNGAIQLSAPLTIGNSVAGEVIALNGQATVAGANTGVAVPATAFNSASNSSMWLPVTHNGTAGYILLAY